MSSRARPVLAAALALALALTACGGTYPIRGGVLHHDPADPVTVRLRDGTVVEGFAFPTDGGAAWWIGRPIPAADVAEARPQISVGQGGLQRAELRLTDGRRVDGLIIETRGPEPEYALAERHSTDTLLEVVRRREALGVLKGAGLGWLAGGALGAIARSTIRDDGASTRPIVLLIGPLSIVTGAMVGYVLGDPISYANAPAAILQTTLVPTSGGGFMGISGRF